MVLLMAGICFLMKAYIGYRIVALLLLLVVSVAAMLLDILPVLLAACLSALIWNFFFIPPLFTFHINGTENVLMFCMYFVVALVNTVLTFNIRKVQEKVRDREEKEKAIILYNTLLNSLSHELRTPVSTIIGALDTMNEPGISLNENTRRELMDAIGQAALRLNTQVENLLNMSRLESGMLKNNSDWCDINELVQALISKTPGLTHRLLFNSDPTLPFLKTDPVMLEQSLVNIISNAMLYTPQGTTIIVSTKFIDEQCQIAVSDHGTGVPEKELKHLFEKFYRLPDSKAGGSGLGLSIAKGFTEANGGTIRAENNPDGGLTVTIQFPCSTQDIKTTFI